MKISLLHNVPADKLWKQCTHFSHCVLAQTQLHYVFNSWNIQDNSVQKLNKERHPIKQKLQTKRSWARTSSIYCRNTEEAKKKKNNQIQFHKTFVHLTWTCRRALSACPSWLFPSLSPSHRPASSSPSLPCPCPSSSPLWCDWCRWPGVSQSRTAESGRPLWTRNLSLIANSPLCPPPLERGKEQGGTEGNGRIEIFF